MALSFGDLVITREPPPPDCKGLFYRYTRQVFRTKKGMQIKEDYRQLKRRSCPGCERCDNLRMLFDELAGEDFIIIDSTASSGDVLELFATSHHISTPDCDEWETELYLNKVSSFKEENNAKHPEVL